MAVALGSVISISAGGTDLAGAREKLAFAAKAMAILKREALESLKANNSRLQQGEFLWHGLLESFSTMGGASGYAGLIGDPVNYAHLSYGKLKKLPLNKRFRHAAKVCIRAGVRYPERKAKFIVGCFDHIEALGGPAQAEQQLLAQPGTEAKIKFLVDFPGIGPKYARNLMMDVYHSDFHHSIAVDSRLQKITSEWGLTFSSYAEHEEFYLSVARAAGLNGWELDRLLFWFQSVFLPPITTPTP